MEKKSKDLNCWDFWHCTEEAKGKCPVHKAKEGRRCWTYTSDLIPFAWKLSPFALANGKDKLKSCKQCPWYKKMHLKLMPRGKSG